MPLSEKSEENFIPHTTKIEKETEFLLYCAVKKPTEKAKLRFLFDDFHTFVIAAVAANLMRFLQLTALWAFGQRRSV